MTHSAGLLSEYLITLSYIPFSEYLNVRLIIVQQFSSDKTNCGRSPHFPWSIRTPLNSCMHPVNTEHLL
jgi:hypothetical protein